MAERAMVEHHDGCECSDYRRKRNEIETLMIEYESAAVTYRDHRGTAAAHGAYALKQALRILDGGTGAADRPRENRARAVQIGAVCALPQAGQEPCPT